MKLRMMTAVLMISAAMLLAACSGGGGLEAEAHRQAAAEAWQKLCRVLPRLERR